MFDFFFRPKAVAVIGASRRKNSVGQGVLKSLIKGGVLEYKTNMPFKGKIFPINPNTESILGLKCYASVLDVKSNIDLAIIAVPAKIVITVLNECVKKKIKGAIIISAGFGELGEEGRKLEQEMLEIARKGNMRILGPNCLGIIRPSKINASFGPCMPLKGNIAFISQSGALIDSVIDWSLETKYGFSTVVSLGNSIDLDVTDFLEWALHDKLTKAIILYIEGIKNGKEFIRIAKKVSKKKPIVALKAGRTPAGISAVSSHTGNLAGSYNIYEAAFKQSGVHLADNMDDLFEMAYALSVQPPCKKNKIAIITNGGGAGVLCADHCETLGIKLSKLSSKTIAAMDKSGKMHPAYSRSNPLDLVGDALHDRYKIAINTLLKQRDIYGLIIIQTLQTMTEPILNAEVVIKAKKRYPNKPIITSYMGGKFSKRAVDLLESNNVPDFNVPYKSARAMKALIDRGKWI